MRKKLTELLLKRSGVSVGMPSIDEDVDSILHRGRSSDVSFIEFMKGQPSQCHENVSLLWNASRDVYTIVTGYALLGGAWCQHSWCERGGVVIETTTERDAYFGFELTPEESDIFYFNNAW